MTWLSFVVKSMFPILLLPYILANYNENDILYWFIYQVIISFINLADLGFSQSIGRFFSYSYAGASNLELPSSEEITSTHGPNFVLLEKLYLVSRQIYLILALISFVLILFIGTYYLSGVIPVDASLFVDYFSWIVVVFTFPVILYGNLFTSLLYGINKVAFLKRVDSFFSFLLFISSVLLIYWDISIQYLVINFQFWYIINSLRNYFIVRIQFSKWDLKPIILDRKEQTSIFRLVFKSAWRSALGILFGFGAFQIAILHYVNFSSVKESNSFLLASRIMTAISEFSKAPFYSKIPYLSILFASSRKIELIQVVKNSILHSFIIFTFLVVVVLVFLDPILLIINSKTDFVNSSVWLVFGLSIFLERYGAMHIQIYSISNHIVWHIANGISGLIFILALSILVHKVGIYSIPLSYLISQVLFYSWYCAQKSYRFLGLKPMKLDFQYFTFIIILFLIMIFFSFNYENRFILF